MAFHTVLEVCWEFFWRIFQVCFFGSMFLDSMCSIVFFLYNIVPDVFVPCCRPLQGRL